MELEDAKYEDIGNLIEGYVWKARMEGGAVFQIWVATDISRKEARKMLLKEANRLCDPDDPAYLPEDIENMWRVSGKGGPYHDRTFADW